MKTKVIGIGIACNEDYFYKECDKISKEMGFDEIDSRQYIKFYNGKGGGY